MAIVFATGMTLAGCNNGTDSTSEDVWYDNNSNPEDPYVPDLNPGQKTCALFFHPNAPEGTPESETPEPKTVTVNIGSGYTLPEEAIFSFEGYYLSGWKSGYSTYKPGESIFISGEEHLYAIWDTSTYINGLCISKGSVYSFNPNEIPADLVIPNGVTAIGWRAFYNYDHPCEIKSVTIPGSVKSIEDGAFGRCPNLEKVVIQEGQLSDIGYDAFHDCESLKSVELPDNVKVIGKNAFQKCAKLESVTINGVETIGDGAFANSGLTSVHLPNSLKSIGKSAFGGCALESITIPDSIDVENIGERVFSYCKKLKKVVLPDNWNEIKSGMFNHCESLTDVNLPSALKIIGEETFSECGLTKVVIPDGVTEICGGAFSNCYSLSKVTIPNSVNTIREGAFRFSPLSEIIIPDNATVEHLAFSLSTNLRTISIPASVINAGIEFWDIFADESMVDCPELESSWLDYIDSRESYLDCRNVDIILREGATSVPEDFMYTGGFSEFKSITIPDSIKKIGNGAFCQVGFETVAISAGLIVEKYAFGHNKVNAFERSVQFNGTKAQYENFLKHAEEVGGNNLFKCATIICKDGIIE